MLNFFSYVCALMSLYIAQCPPSSVAGFIEPLVVLFMPRVSDATFEFINGSNVLTLAEKQCSLLINCVFTLIMGEVFAFAWGPEYHALSRFEWNLCLSMLFNMNDMISGKDLYKLLKEYYRDLTDLTKTHLTEMAVSAVALIIVTILALLQHNDIMDYIMTFIIAVMLLTANTECLYIHCIHITRKMPGVPNP